VEAKTRKKALYIVGSLLAVLVVAAGLVVYFMVARYNALGEDPSQAFGQPTAPGAGIKTSPTPPPKQAAAKNHTNIMLLGMDNDDVRDSKSMGTRNDMNMIISINNDTKAVKMLVIPRDTRIQVSKIDSSGKEVSSTVDRINTAYGAGGYEDGKGFDNVMLCTSRFLSCNNTYTIPIDGYACINLDGIEPICKAVGGVPLKLDADFPGLGWVKGQTVTIKGEQAQMFLRWRHPDQVGDSKGDIGRGERQQEFLIALAKKIKSMGAVETVTKLFSSMTTYMRTSLNLDQITSLATMLKGMNLDNIKMYSVDGTNVTVGDASMWEPDMTKLPAQVQEVFYQ
jgi:polyisoprenyl-teichoic acid--peptidoglycan teichoic acid transferase